MVNKRAVSWTIDEDILEKIEKEAEEQKRSLSFIVNEYLKEKFKKNETKKENNKGFKIL